MRYLGTDLSQGKIIKILSTFSNNTSYGLPIGGNASRILAELAINAVDEYLDQNSIDFCRFVDDYHIFANSKDEAYKYLVTLSKTLIQDHGLSLQKSKTRIMTSEEFVSSPMLVGKKNDSAASKIMNFSVKFDPYSPTAEEDYETLKAEIQKVDIIKLLNKEIAKTMIHRPLVTKIIKTLKYINLASQQGAIESILNNIETLYPVLPVIMITLKSMFDDFDEKFKEKICKKLNRLYWDKSFILQTENNLAYVLRVLSCKETDESIRTLTDIYNKTSSTLLKKDIILIMTKWQNHSWLSSNIKNFNTVDTWCRRAMIMSSYVLEDEGKHWRTHNKKNFSDFEKIVMNWAADKKNKKPSWSIPL